MNKTALHKVRGLVCIVAGTGTFLAIMAGILGSNLSLLLDLVTIGIIFMLSASLYLFTPRKYKTHASGIVVLLVLLLLLVTTTSIIVQVLIILLVVANAIYFLFYLGIYTACIDQVREDGISSDEYIKDFTFKTGQQGQGEGGFLKKTPGGGT